MTDKARFAAAGLLADNLPPFQSGYSRSDGKQFWLLEQPSDFYRRELLLHEGTHCFMFTVLKGAGPPWYKEGMAEYLGTHRWQDGRLTLGYMPRSREEVPYWRRIWHHSRRRGTAPGAATENGDRISPERVP